MSSSTVNPTTPPVLTPASLGINLNNTLGAAFIGLIISSILYGVNSLQCVHYFQNFGRDSKALKTTVAILWILDTFMLACICELLYTYLVTDFSDILSIAKVSWTFSTIVLTDSISDFLVQVIYLHRLWIISNRNPFLTIPPVLTAVASAVIGTVVGIRGYSFSSTTQFLDLSGLIYTSFATSIISDLWIALSLCYFLSINKTGFLETDKKLEKLTTYVINTGLLTSICAICILVTYATMPQNYIFFAFLASDSKLFFNSLLAMLNARRNLNSLGSSGSGATSSNATNSYRLPRFAPGQSRTSAHLLSIDSHGNTELQSFTDLSDSKFGRVHLKESMA